MKNKRKNDQSFVADNSGSVSKSMLISSSQSPSKYYNVPNYLKATATHQIYKKIVTNRQDYQLGRVRPINKM